MSEIRIELETEGKRYPHESLYSAHGGHVWLIANNYKSRVLVNDIEIKLPSYVIHPDSYQSILDKHLNKTT